MERPPLRSGCWERYPIVFPRERTAVPSSGGISCMMIFKSVDLPAPLTPTIAAFSWSSIWKEAFFRTSLSPKDLVIFWTSRIMIPSAQGDIIAYFVFAGINFLQSEGRELPECQKLTSF